VDKWKPERLDDLVGNQQGVKTLQTWLADWERVHLHGGTPQSAPGAGSAKKDMSKKAVLVSGSPGIGKTTAASLIAR
jgi:replication factor C subunit 1